MPIFTTAHTDLIKEKVTEEWEINLEEDLIKVTSTNYPFYFMVTLERVACATLTLINNKGEKKRDFDDFHQLTDTILTIIKSDGEYEMINFVNLTPHTLNIMDKYGHMIEITPSGTTARLDDTRVKVDEINGVTVYRTEYGYPKNVPEPKPNTIYIVSSLLMNHPTILDRQDVVAPGIAIRDENGNIIGAEGLSIPTLRY